MSTHRLQQSKSLNQISSDSIITPQQIYQTLIRQTPNLYPLCKFKTIGSNKHFFPDAVKFPDFFNYNLVSPGRVIKRLQGRESVIRGFYYQLMKLAFQIQVQQRDYIEVLKNVIFSPQFMLQENPSSPSSGKNYSDLQYKKIVAEFMQILIHQSIPNFQLTILNYPIVDQAMLKILQNLLKFKSSIDLYSNIQVSSFQILRLLSQTFQVTVVEYGNCYKFQQSDIFLYEHSRNEFYIAFLNEMAEMSDMSESSLRKESSYEPGSSRKIAQQSFDSQEKKQVKTHQYLQSDYDSQSPMRGSQNQIVKNLSQQKKKQKNIESDNSNRYTFGFSEIKSFQSIVSNDYENNPIISEKRVPLIQKQRESRQSLINELHILQYQTYDGLGNNNYAIRQKQQSSNKKANFPGIQMANSISHQSPSTYNNIQSYQTNNQTINNYQYQPKGYSKKVGFQQFAKPISISGQSDQVIGYSQTFNKDKFLYKNQYSSKFDFLSSDQTKVQNDYKSYCDFNNKPKQLHNYGFTNTNNQQSLIKKQDFTKWNQQISKINSTSLKNNQKFSSKPQTEEDIFYSPKSQKPITPKTNYLSQQTNYQSKPIKNQQSVGTLYRQFTDTKILDILPDQVQYNIRRMKRKFKGVHSKDLFVYKKF